MALIRLQTNQFNIPDFINKVSKISTIILADEHTINAIGKHMK